MRRGGGGGRQQRTRTTPRAEEAEGGKEERAEGGEGRAALSGSEQLLFEAEEEGEALTRMTGAAAARQRPILPPLSPSLEAAFGLGSRSKTASLSPL